MSNYKRSGNKWSINELLTLQREYELLEMDVYEISTKHKRTVEAILHKLESEGFISSWNDARGYSVKVYSVKENKEINNKRVDTVVNDTSVSEVDKLNDRIWSLETSVEEINGLVKQMLQNMSSKQKAVYLTK
jgi:DNA-binding PadR family transcriptional regulator